MTTETIGVLLKAEGYDNFIRQMKQAQQAVTALTGKSLNVDFSSNAKELKKQLTDISRDITSLTRRKQTLQLELKDKKIEAQATELGSDARKRIEAEIDDIQAEITKIDYDKTALNSLKSELQNTINDTAVNWKGVFTRGKSVMGDIGSSIQTFGNAVTNLGRNVITETLIGALRQVGASFTNTISEGLSGSIERYDIIRTYPKVIARAFGDTDEASAAAERSIDMMKEAVQGMPTGLDEMVDAAQRYGLVMNDIEKGARLAIAADSAFLASGATESQKYQGLMQLNDLISGKELNSREWMSLIAAMPVGIRKIGESMGYTGDHYKEFVNMLKENEIDNDVFVDRLIELGEMGGELRGLAEAGAMEKLGTAFTIMRQAWTRLGESVIDALDSALLKTTGKGIVDTVRSLKGEIDKISAGIVGWIEKNPQAIANAIQKLKSIDVIGFLKGFANGIKNSVKLVAGALKLLPGKEGFLGSVFGSSIIVGRLLTTVGGFIKSTRILGGVIAVLMKRAEVGGGGGLFGKLFTGKNTVADVSKATKSAEVAAANAAKAFANLKNVAAKAGTAFIATTAVTAMFGELYLIGKAVEKIGTLKIDKRAVGTTAALAGVMATLSGAIIALAKFTKAMPSITEVAKTAGIITLVFATLTANTGLLTLTAKEIKVMVKDLNEIGKVTSNFQWSKDSLDTVVDAMGDLATLGTYSLASTVLGVAGLLEIITTGELTVIAKEFKSLVKDLKTIAKLSNSEALKKGVDTTGIKNMLKSISDVYGVFGTEEKGLAGVNEKNFNRDKMENVNDMVEAFNSLVQSMNTIVTTMSSMADTMVALTERNSQNVSKLGRVKQGMERIIEAMLEVYDSFKVEKGDPLYETAHGTGAKETADAGNANSLVGTFAEMVGSISSIVTTMNEMADGLVALTERQGQNASKLSRAKVDIEKLGPAIGEIIDALWVSLPNTNRADLAAQNMTSFNTALGQIQSAVTTMLEMAEDLAMITSGNKETGLFGFKTSTLGQLSIKIQKVVDALGKIMSSFTKGDWAEIDTTATVEKAQSMESVIVAVSEALAEIASAQTTLAENNIPTSGSFPMADAIKNIITQLDTSLSGIEGEDSLGTKLFQFDLAINKLKKSLSALGGIKGIGSFVKNLKAIPKALESVTSSMEGIGATWKTAFLKGFNAVEIRASINGALSGALGNLSYYNKGYNAGATFVNGFNAALAGINTNINLNVTASGLAGIASRIAGLRAAQVGANIPLSTGGFLLAQGRAIYRAGGGSIFRPRGTDTIPAMLTPGEYVVRRNAVKAFGTHFMQRINNLDIDGAIRELSMRAGASLVPHNTSIVNNTTNKTNNARVTQNITTNNPMFSYRRANRWARQL